MNYYSTVSFLLLIYALSAQAQELDTLRTNDFQLLFPIEYRQQGVQSPSDLGVIELEVRQALAPPLVLRVVSGKLPTSPSDQAGFMQDRVGAIQEEIKGEILSMNFIQVDAGLSLQFMLAYEGEKRIKGRVHLNENDYVETWVFSDKDNISNTSANLFLDGFRWNQTQAIDLSALLDAAGFSYERDEQGDFKLVLQFQEEGRSQVGYVTQFVSPAHGKNVVEIWSPVLMSEGMLPQAIADRLLTENGRISWGNFQNLRLEGGRNMAIFSYLIEGKPSPERFKKSIETVLIVADDMEVRLSPDQDRY